MSVKALSFSVRRNHETKRHVSNKKGVGVGIRKLVMVKRLSKGVSRGKKGVGVGVGLSSKRRTRR